MTSEREERACKRGTPSSPRVTTHPLTSSSTAPSKYILERDRADRETSQNLT